MMALPLKQCSQPREFNTARFKDSPAVGRISHLLLQWAPLPTGISAMTGKFPAKKLYIKTHGCQMNEYDSDKMADVLNAGHGLELTQDACPPCQPAPGVSHVTHS